MTNYFRITGYYPQEDFCFIVDANGKFDQVWKFSSRLVKKGMKILEVGDAKKFLDVNLTKVSETSEKIFLRATAKGKPEYTSITLNGAEYRAVKVGDKTYVPNKN